MDLQEGWIMNEDGSRCVANWITDGDVMGWSGAFKIDFHAE
jgi:hypothetical protein